MRTGCLGTLIGGLLGVVLADRLLVWSGLLGRRGCMSGLDALPYLPLLPLAFVAGAFAGTYLLRRLIELFWRWQTRPRKRRRR
jgi:hypothetical protein